MVVKGCVSHFLVPVSLVSMGFDAESFNTAPISILYQLENNKN